jgi:hypothetical protein
MSSPEDIFKTYLLDDALSISVNCTNQLIMKLFFYKKTYTNTHF